VAAYRSQVSEVSGHAGGDPQHEDENDEHTHDDARHAAQSPCLTTRRPAPGHTLCELTHTDDAHGPGASTGLQRPTTVTRHGRQPPGRCPSLALLAPATLPAVPGGRHRQKYPAMSSCDHRGWRTAWRGANSTM